MFNSLTRENINKIIDIELRGLYDRVRSLGHELKISNAARDFIAEKGFDANYGARPLKRAIQKYLEDPMAEAMIKISLTEGDYVSVGLNSAKDEIRIKIVKKKAELPESGTTEAEEQE
jgi:ATP-dependent Clp protease ATP-binding subunit ClpC